MSDEHKNYLKNIKHVKYKIIFLQILLIAIIIFLWEFLVNKEILSAFLYSSPSRIINTIKDLIVNGNFFNHIFITLYEVLIAFFLGITIGFILAIILYEFKLFAKIIDPFLTMINSLPKIALGPLIIIVAGANVKSVIIMALLINLIICTITIYNGFLETNEYQLKLFKTLKASKWQVLTRLVIPSSYRTIIATCKLCIAQTLVGVIMGEFLVSKEGIGYLIVYGKQVFNLNLIMTGIILLAILSYILYIITVKLEKHLLKHI